MIGRPAVRMLHMGAMLWPHARAERWHLAVGVALGLAATALQLLQPWPVKWALDHLTGTGPGRRPPPWPMHDPGSDLWTFGALYLLLALTGAWASYGHMMLVNGLVNRTVYRFRSGLFAQVLQQPLVFHESRGMGELVTRVVYDTSRLRRGLVGVLLSIVQPLTFFVLVLATLMAVDVRLGGIFGAGGVVALLVMRRRGRRIARAARKQRKREGRLAALVADELAAIREIQTFGLHGSAVLQRFAGRNHKSLLNEEKVRRLAAGLMLRTEILLAATTALAVWVGARAIHTSTLPAGDLLLFFSYALLLRHPLTQLAYQTARVGRTYACAERLAKIAGRGSAAGRPGVEAPPLAGDIRFEAVWYKGPKRLRSSRKWTLQDLSCELPAGRRTALVGPNGAGKSTLLRMILGLIEPDRGVIRLDGRDLGDYQIETVRRQISVVFQDSVFTRQTVRENLALGIEPQSPEAVRAAAEAAGVGDWIEQLPQGYDTPVTRAGHLFSGGERQRLALARAILRDGRLWLLDEPTTGLDAQGTQQLVEVLLDITRERTSVWITHDPALLERFDWVVEMAEGGVAFAGPPQEHRRWRAERPPEPEGEETPCRP